MFPYQFYPYNQYPNEQLNYDQSIPYQSDNYYNEERTFGQPLPFPSPGGPPSGLPGSQGPMGPQGQGPQSGPPSSPPPAFVPAQTHQQVSTFAVDPGSIRRCLFRYTYVWQRNRQQYWLYPIFVGRNSVSGWRWNGFSWVYFGVSLREIESFTCV
ncbi:hypothetical protein R4Z10_12520 [Niallia sp. XMNu-256]|uniref:hypothetical protein n=1 Tax=Niallia sp. XMNu-256 TaxID=3082444 RepID=UPI0030CF09B2